MEKYEKRTKYLDYIEYDNKIRNGGVLQTERDGDQCRVQITIRGLYPTDTIPAEIYLEDGEKRYKVDAMMLHYGAGTYSAIWNAKNLAGSGLAYPKWCGIVLAVSEHRFLHSKWEMEATTITDVQAPMQEIVVEEGNEEPLETIVEEWKMPAEEPKEVAAEDIMEQVEEVTDKMSENIPEEQANNPSPELEKEEKGRFTELYEDKWTQLQQHYRMIRPFGDGRTYLSITPKDFIVLSRRYQKLVSNSFLLHGYYNYGHLILVRTGASDEYRYYLGVPGIYHEREKQAARMFGFEGFEGAVSPCSEGGFGYYMLQVEI